MNTRVAAKIVVCLFSGAAVVACSFYVTNNLRRYRSAGPAAKEMRIEEAITLQSVADDRPRWVRITSKMVPTCQNMQISSNGDVESTTHLALDETKKYGLFLKFEGDVGCPTAAQRTLEGMLTSTSTAFWEHDGGTIPQTMLPLMELEVGQTRRLYLENVALMGAFELLMAVLFVVVFRLSNQDPRQKRPLRAPAGPSHLPL